MLLAQKNILYLSQNDKNIVDKLSLHSARLYNSCCYNIKQRFLNNNEYLPFKEQYQQICDNPNFKLLINDSAQQTFRIVDKSYRSFFSLLKLKAKGKYSGDIKTPHYLPKDKGWSVFVAGRSVRVKNNSIYIGLSKAFKELYNIQQRDLILPLPKNINRNAIHQLQIKPAFNGREYQMIIVYEKEVTPFSLNKNNYLSIDCGLDNLFTCYDSKNHTSFIISGKHIKSVNQFYNKKKAMLQSNYDVQHKKLTDGKRFMLLSNKRNSIITEQFNLIVKYVTNYCVKNDIGTLIMGDFKGIKQEMNIGKVNTQNFVSIPFYKLKSKLSSKCEQLGIEYHLQEESYTSKCSCIDLEMVGKHEEYQGKRIKRGLYVSHTGIQVNADLNGSVNILRKYLKSKSKGDLSLDDVRALSTCHPTRIKSLLRATKSLA